MDRRMKNFALALSIVTLTTFTSAGIAASMYGHSLEGGIPFVAGGVGKDNRSELELLSPRYHLRVTNALRTGELVSDIHVRLRDANGRIVLDTIASGPILLADPLPGAYTLESEFQGQNQTRNIRIGSGSQTEVKSSWRLS